MPRVTVELPSLLVAAAGGRDRLEVEGRTLRGALDALCAEAPSLRSLLFDEGGAFREHVLCFHNGRSTRWMEGLDGAVAEGDSVRILQAVSGG